MAKVEIAVGHRQHVRRPARLASTIDAGAGLARPAGHRRRHPPRARGREQPLRQRPARRAALAADRLRARRRQAASRSARHARREARRRHACRDRARPRPPATSCSRSSAATSASRPWSRRPMRPGLRRSSTTRPRWARRRSTWAAARPRVGVFAGGHLVHADGDRGRRRPCHHGRRARPLDPRRRGRAAQDALWRDASPAASDERETIAVPPVGDDERDDAAPSCRGPSWCASSGRGSRRSSNSCATASRAPGLAAAGRPPRRADRRSRQLTGLPDSPARSSSGRSASAGRSASTACRKPPRGRPSRRRSASSSIRRSPVSSISSRSGAARFAHRHATATCPAWVAG